MNLSEFESISLWAALLCHAVVTILAMVSLVFKRSLDRVLLVSLTAGVLLHTLAIGLRWWRLGQVPVLGNFEMLSANIWGLTLAAWLAFVFMKRVRAWLALVMPVVLMLMAWMMLMPATQTALPPTYDTIWLFVHIGFIKLFLGCAFVALGLALLILARQYTTWGSRWAEGLTDRALDERAYRFMALGLIFDTLGIIAGAIWAQDAWGHYWSWDPLEVWSLVTWLTIGLTLHLRASYQTRPAVNASLIVLTWVVAFFTFFGIPFVSKLHKGVV